MKRFLPVLIVLAFAEAKAQSTYSPMLDSLTWLTEWDNFTGTWYTWNYSHGDTVINGYDYQRYPGAFLREDTLARKVYKWDSSNNIDLLLYDFTLNIGDTFHLYSNDITVNQDVVVTGKDSLLTYAGYRDRWYLLWHDGLGNPFVLVFVESIGSLGDPVRILCPPNYDPQWFSRCFYHHGVKTYGSICPTYLTNLQLYTMPATCGQCNGSVFLFATFIPDTLLWSLPQYSWTMHGPVVVGNLCPQTSGTVIVTQTSTHLQYADYFYIQDNPPAVLQSASSIPASCQSCCDGSITVSASAGTPPYNYSWSPNVSSSNSASGLCSGTYYVTVTDSAGCSDQDTITISFTAGIESILKTEDEIMYLEIFDLSARKVWEGTKVDWNNNSGILSNGMYVQVGLDAELHPISRKKLYITE